MESLVSMSAISISRPEFLGSVQDLYRNHLKFHTKSASLSPMMVFKSPQTIKKENNSIQISTPTLLPLSASNDELRFNRPLPDDQELANVKKFEFNQFIVRKAVINEEIWTAAWLRALSHWEDQSVGRNDDVFKKRYAEEEFKAIQKRGNGRYGLACTCVVTVKNEHMHKKELNVVSSVVGTLDLSLRRLLRGETFPVEREWTHLGIINKDALNRYAYVTNLCVRKSERRQGIATNMLKFAINMARCCDIEELYVHVRRDNIPALALYEKLGFEVVEIANSTLVKVNKYLLCIDTEKVRIDIAIHSDDSCTDN